MVAAAVAVAQYAVAPTAAFAAASNGYGLVPAQPSLSTRLVIPQHHAKAGTPLAGKLIITNKSNETVDLTASTPNHCLPSFAVVLTNQQIPPFAAFTTSCDARSFTVRPGRNQFPFQLRTTYEACSNDTNAPTTPTPKVPSGIEPDVPRCIGLNTPNLPAGNYHAVVVGDGTLALPYPHPVNITMR